MKIPTVEKLVPFPNFATVLLQHAREFPEKIALNFTDEFLTYQALAEYCESVCFIDGVISISMLNPKEDLRILLACLYQGKTFDLNFSKESKYDIKNVKIGEKLKYFEPPYVKLDDTALTLNAKHTFDQYKVLLAAQAIGKAFRLFRPGAAYCPLDITTVSDLVFGVLAPLYNCKTIEFAFNKEKNHYQYSWRHEIVSDLRDNAFIFPKNASTQGYLLLDSFDYAMGLGPIQAPNGQIMELLGYEFERLNGAWKISGHGLSC